jgi:hypothetical protein
MNRRARRQPAAMRERAGRSGRGLRKAALSRDAAGGRDARHPEDHRPGRAQQHAGLHRARGAVFRDGRQPRQQPRQPRRAARRRRLRPGREPAGPGGPGDVLRRRAIAVLLLDLARPTASSRGSCERHGGTSGPFAPAGPRLRPARLADRGADPSEPRRGRDGRQPAAGVPGRPGPGPGDGRGAARRRSDGREGQLAPRFNALVRRETCAAVAAEIGLGEALRLGRSERLSGGRRKAALAGRRDGGGDRGGLSRCRVRRRAVA